MDFEKRCKDADTKFTEKINDMRKQLDNRWKQIDKFEASLKTYAETKLGWKKKLGQKEGELEAVKVCHLLNFNLFPPNHSFIESTNSDLAAQLASLKRPTGSESTEIRSLTTRAQNAERRLNNAQNQLLSTEEKLATINQKTAVADSKWEARVKEYEARLKAAEERVKRERQGSKERVLELENSLKCVFMMVVIFLGDADSILSLFFKDPTTTA
jgi:chromosome segregation ATPase